MRILCWLFSAPDNVNKAVKKYENLKALKNTTKIPSLKRRQHALIIGNEAYDYLSAVAHLVEQLASNNSNYCLPVN